MNSVSAAQFSKHSYVVKVSTVTQISPLWSTKNPHPGLVG